MAVAGIQPETTLNLQGQSLAPVFYSRNAARFRTASCLLMITVYFYPAGTRCCAYSMCPRGELKVCHVFRSRGGFYPTEYEMYDLVRDPLETANLAHGEHSDSDINSSVSAWKMNCLE